MEANPKFKIKRKEKEIYREKNEMHVKSGVFGLTELMLEINLPTKNKRSSKLKRTRSVGKTNFNFLSMSYLERKKRVDVAREILELEDLQNKFIKAHKHEIYNKYEAIVKWKVREIGNKRLVTEYLIGMIKLYELGTILYKQFYVT